MIEEKRLTITIYLLINTALFLSLALPAAGMVNHLLPFGEANFTRGLELWLIGCLACLLVTIPLLPLIRRRIRSSLEKKLT